MFTLLSPIAPVDTPALDERSTGCGHLGTGICDSCTAELNQWCDDVDAIRAATEDHIGDDARCEAAAVTPEGIINTLRLMVPRFTYISVYTVEGTTSNSPEIRTSKVWTVQAGVHKGESRNSLHEAFGECVRAIASAKRSA